jgi:hypothetical protein
MRKKLPNITSMVFLTSEGRLASSLPPPPKKASENTPTATRAAPLPIRKAMAVASGFLLVLKSIKQVAVGVGLMAAPIPRGRSKPSRLLTSLFAFRLRCDHIVH